MFRVAVFSMTFSLALSGSAVSGPYEDIAGQAVAASFLGEWCASVSRVGGDQQGFVFAVSDIAKAQGLRKQKTRKILFYGKSDGLRALGMQALTARGIPTQKSSKTCKFAARIAGTNDAIGRFLIKN
jgi:hypothetical protein